jgi:H/ACA ribonucleoprotein complex subunit 4
MVDQVVECVKDLEETDPDYGYKPEDRPPDFYIESGMINLDKPPGPTSHQVSAWVKGIVGASKAGHGGTLDPTVTGVLPIGLEHATNALTYIIGSSKEYVGVMRLHGDVDSEELERVASIFQGRIYQRPPQKSAVRRKLRTRNIYKFDVLEVDGRDILFHVDCESGFYVRKLVHDVGLVLGVDAHLQELRRKRAGPFGEGDSLVSLYQVKSAFHTWLETEDFSYVKRVVQPLERTFKDFPRIVIRDSAVSAVCHGAQLAVPGILRVTSNLEKGKRAAIFTQKEEMVAVSWAQMSPEEILEASHGLAATLERVIMPRDVYPRMWLGEHRR